MAWFIVLFSLIHTAYADDRIKIAIVDTGINVSRSDIKPYLCHDGHYSSVDTSPLVDVVGHGTNIASLIVRHVDVRRFCLVSIKFMNAQSSRRDYYYMALHYLRGINVSYVNLSLHGDLKYSFEYRELKNLISKGVRISVAAGNESRNLDTICDAYPACYNFPTTYFHVVGAAKDGKVSRYSNFGKKVRFYENGTHQGYPAMTGTSQSTATHTGKWANESH